MYRRVYVIKEIFYWNIYIILVSLFYWLKKINVLYEKDLKDRLVKLVFRLCKIIGGWFIVLDVKWD